MLLKQRRRHDTQHGNTSLRENGTYLNSCHLEKWGTGTYKLEESFQNISTRHIIKIKVGKYLNNSHHLDKICEICSLLKRKPDHI